MAEYNNNDTLPKKFTHMVQLLGMMVPVLVLVCLEERSKEIWIICLCAAAVNMVIITSAHLVIHYLEHIDKKSQ